MTFQNRIEAGKLLAMKLSSYQGKQDAIAVGLARGGVVVAAVVAKQLAIALDVMIVRKIGAPDNPELAVGAIAEKGKGVFNEDLISLLGVSKEYLKAEGEKQQEVIKKRKELYLKGRSVDFAKKTVLLIDDGIATGASMKVAIESARAQNAKKVIVAVPVAPKETIEAMESYADEVICLSVPSRFPAVGAFYKEFSQVTDEEIMEILQKS